VVHRAKPGQRIDTPKRLAAMAYLLCIMPRIIARVR
jgi:hypothetical protein